MGRVARRAQLEATIQSAGDAALKGDQKSLFAIIRRLAPKSLKHRIHFRSEAGHMLSTESEMELLVQHCQEVFGQGKLVPGMSNLHTPFHLEVETLEAALAKLRPSKATPLHSAPVAVWKLCGEVLCQWLSVYTARIWCDRAVIPTRWSDADMFWLPKGKPVFKPSDLRPIGLQDVGAKVISRALNSHVAPLVATALRHLPQFAYTKGRTLENALLRVVAHCSRIRQVFAHAPDTLHARFRGETFGNCYGGVQIAVDLSKAFDMVNRSDLCSSLRTCRVPDHLISLIIELHNHVAYNLSWKNHTARVSCLRGVRQGCCLAPTMWTALTVNILLEAMSTAEGFALKQLLTMFADDIHGAWEIKTSEDLERTMQDIRRLFTVLSKFHLVANASKCKVIIRLKGSFALTWRKKHLFYKNSEQFLAVPGEGASLSLPVVDRFTYLGVIVSYHRFQDQSTHHRLATAEAQRIRLIKFLHGRRGISLRKRTLLWQSCVWSSASYGMAVVGFSQHGAAAFSARVMRQLRALAGSPVHITGESNSKLLCRLGLEHPLKVLADCGQALLRKFRDSADPMVNEGMVMTHLAQVSATTRVQWQEAIARPSVPARDGNNSLPMQGAAPGAHIEGRKGPKQARFLCEHCLLCFADLSTLKRHLVSTHQAPMPAWSGAFEREEHSVGGLPTCRHCGQSLGSWSHLRRHITDNHCPVHWLSEHGMKVDEVDRETSEAGPVGEAASPVDILSPETDGHNERTLLAFTQTLDVPAPSQNNPALPPSVHQSHEEVSLPTQIPQKLQPVQQSRIAISNRQQVIDIVKSRGWLALIADAKVCTEMSVYCVICGQWLADKTQMKVHTQRIHSTLWREHQARATAECKIQAHVVTSPCHFCGTTVKRTKEHAYKCTVMWQAALTYCLHVPPNGPTAIATCSLRQAKPSKVSLLDDASLISAWQRQGFQALLRHEAVLASSLRCVLCGDVVKTHKVLKLHIRGMHRSVFDLHSAAASAQCTRLPVKPVSPCVYCGRHVVKPSAHPGMCSVIWQAALIDEILKASPHVGDCGRGNGALRSGPTVCETPSGGGGAGVLQESQGTGSDRGRQGQERPRQGRSRTRERRRLRWKQPPADSGQPRVQDGAPGMRRGAAQGSASVGPSARGPPSAAEPGHDTCLDVRECPGTTAGLEHDVQRDSNVEEAARRDSRKAHAQPSNYGNPGSLPGAVSAPYQGSRSAGSQGGGGEAGLAAERPVALLEVESRPRSTCEGHRGGAGAAGDFGDAGSEGTRAAQEPRCSSQVSVHSSVGRGADREHALFPKRTVPTRSRSPRTVEPDQLVVWACSSQHDWSANPAGSGASLQVGGSASAGTRQVLSLKLQNPGNLCYVHTCVHCLAWMEATSGEFFARFGVHRQAFLSVLSARRPLTLLGHSLWKQVIREWHPRYMFQQDAGEFLSYFLADNMPGSLEGVWLERYLDAAGRVQSRDVSSVSPLPIALDPSARAATVQELVSSWHHTPGETKVRAFLMPPSCLCLQLLRFQYDRRLQCAVKTQIACIYPRERFLSLPCFSGNGMECSSVQYRLDALSLHHGLTPQQGHYTSIFLEGGSERAWHANDGATAKPVDAECLSSLAADAYLLWYRRLH